MEYNMKLGWIEVICGPMFAGKSEELIRRIKRLEYAKKKVVVFKPTIDNRYSENEVVSHNKRSTKCYNLSNSLDAFKYIDDTTYAVAFDEVQFIFFVALVASTLSVIHKKLLPKIIKIYIYVFF